MIFAENNRTELFHWYSFRFLTRLLIINSTTEKFVGQIKGVHFASFFDLLLSCSSLPILRFSIAVWLYFIYPFTYCNELFAVIKNQLRNSISCFVHVDEYHHNEEYAYCSFHFFDSVKTAFTTNRWKERKKSKRIGPNHTERMWTNLSWITQSNWLIHLN